MSSDAARFTRSIPELYDRCLGPMIFVDYAADIARRTAAFAPARVLETAAGTGIVTRRLRDALLADTRLMATDLNPPMLEIARQKFRPGEQVEFQAAAATALPFADRSFDAVHGHETTVDHALIRGLVTAGPDASRSCLGLGSSVG